MDLGKISNEEAEKYGKPLNGVMILAVEQMQALPFATQLLARLGAEVVKIEHPTKGESAGGAAPSVSKGGRSQGAALPQGDQGGLPRDGEAYG